MFCSSEFDISPKGMCCCWFFASSLFRSQWRFLLYLSPADIKQPLPCENLTATLPSKDKAMRREKSYSEESCNVSIAACVCEHKVWPAMRMGPQLPLKSFVCVSPDRLLCSFCLDMSMIYSKQLQQNWASSLKCTLQRTAECWESVDCYFN
jgi:hypothetical protein